VANEAIMKNKYRNGIRNIHVVTITRVRRWQSELSQTGYNKNKPLQW